MKRIWSRVHFLIRFLGLTGLLASGVGGALAYYHGLWPGVETAWNESWQALLDKSRVLIEEGAGETLATAGVYLVAGGVTAVLIALLIELIGILFFAAGRRSAFGTNAVVQAVLAVALLVGVNVYSFSHFRVFDWTREQQFTFKTPELLEELPQLKADTTILVYLMNPKGTLSDKLDAYEDAAARKIVEKVHDLVDQLRRFGGQFRVEVLDRKNENYENELKRLTADNAALRDALEEAAESSIFFTSQKKVQRLSFNEFYRLDKVASQEDNNKRGNLVLLYQTEKPFAQRVLGIEEKRPRIGIATVHEFLTTRGPVDYGFKGLAKALKAQGFDVQDIILKKWSEFGPPEPGVYTYDESLFDRLEEELVDMEADIKVLEREVALSVDLVNLWSKSSLEELSKKYAKQLAQSRLKSITEQMRAANLAQFRATLEFERAQLESLRKAREETAKEKAGLNVDGLAERRRVTDLKAKLSRALADCDLLLIPRMTLRNVNIEDRIPNRIFRIEDIQIDAIKDFLKSGKPVLACFGPTNEPADRGRPDPGGSGPDKLEEALADLGIQFGKQTVLFGADAKSFAERRTGLLVAGASVEVPPVSFEWEAGAGLPRKFDPADTTAPHPIREGMRITARSTTQKLDLRLRHPRPIYFDPAAKKLSGVAAEIMMADRDSWNEENPYPSRERTPRFDRPKDDDPARGTLDEKRRGPFPIGVAVETAVPASWYDDPNARPATVRVAAIGHGGLFSGEEIKPAAEQLFVHTCNWLLQRERLPRADHPWKYPRVDLSERGQALWLLAALVLPFLFGYLGLIVWLVRRLR